MGENSPANFELKRFPKSAQNTPLRFTFSRLAIQLCPADTVIGQLMDRRKFLKSSGSVALSTLLPNVSGLASTSNPLEPFQWETDALVSISM